MLANPAADIEIKCHIVVEVNKCTYISLAHNLSAALTLVVPRSKARGITSAASMFQEYLVSTAKCMSLHVDCIPNTYSLDNILSLEVQVFPETLDNAKDTLCWHVCIYWEFR